MCPLQYLLHLRHIFPPNAYPQTPCSHFLSLVFLNLMWGLTSLFFSSSVQSHSHPQSFHLPFLAFPVFCRQPVASPFAPADVRRSGWILWLSLWSLLRSFRWCKLMYRVGVLFPGSFPYSLFRRNFMNYLRLNIILLILSCSFLSFLSSFLLPCFVVTYYSFTPALGEMLVVRATYQ